MSSTIISLDVGERRIGVAIARLDIRFPSPLATVERGDDSPAQIKQLLDEHDASALVIGLPRSLQGDETAQTQAVKAFAQTLNGVITVPVYWMDEAVTSHKAEQELIARGKPYKKGDIDALSAVYILEDFLRDHPEDGRENKA